MSRWNVRGQKVWPGHNHSQNFHSWQIAILEMEKPVGYIVIGEFGKNRFQISVRSHSEIGFEKTGIRILEHLIVQQQIREINIRDFRIDPIHFGILNDDGNTLDQILIYNIVVRSVRNMFRLRHSYKTKTQ